MFLNIYEENDIDNIKTKGNSNNNHLRVRFENGHKITINRIDNAVSSNITLTIKISCTCLYY